MGQINTKLSKVNNKELFVVNEIKMKWDLTIIEKAPLFELLFH